MKKFTVVVLTLMLVLTACGNTGENAGSTTGDSGSEVNVGLLAVTSGPVAEYGVASSNGTKLALELIKEKDYLEGKKIKEIIYDTEGDQTKAINLFNKLVSNDKIVALIGPVISANALAVAPVANENKIPMITPTGTYIDITPDYETVFRSCFTDPYQGILAGQFTVENLKAKRVAVIYNVGNDYSSALANEFVQVVTADGVEITNNEGYGDEDKDFSALAAKLKATNPEMIFIPDYFNKVGIIVGQLRAAGIKSTILGGDGWDGVLANYAKEVEGCYYLTHFSVNDTSEKTVEFVEAYRKKYNMDPSSFAALGYDGGLVMAEAIKNAKTTKSADILEALKNIKVQGVTGTIEFDEDGNPKNKEVIVIKVVNGEPTIDTKIKKK